VKAEDTIRDVLVTLRRAPVLRGRVVGPDGKAVPGTRLLYTPPLPTAADRDAAANDLAFVNRVWLDVSGSMLLPGDLQAYNVFLSGVGIPAKLKDCEFAVQVNDPESVQRLHFFAPDSGLGAVMELKGQQAGPEPVTVRLERLGAAQVRFLDATGKPLANYRPLLWLMAGTGPVPAPPNLKKLIDMGINGLTGNAAPDAAWLARFDPPHYGDGPGTDAEGRVTLPALIPGARYGITLGDSKAREFTVRAGQTLTLPDLVIDHPELTAKLPKVGAGK
jgi:hypothetical protein